jgi:hypothetical protein
MLRALNALSIVVIGLMLAACAAGPKYSDVQSSIPPLSSEQGRVYFYRSSSMVGAAIQPSIKLNGEKVGASKPGGFFYIDRPPGNYEAVCGTEVERKADFVLNAGQQRYIKTTISMGVLVGHVTPELVDPTEGMAAIQSLHYAPPDSGQK